MKSRCVAVIFAMITAMIIAVPVQAHVPYKCEELEEAKQFEEVTKKMQDFVLEVGKKVIDEEFKPGAHEYGKLAILYGQNMVALGGIFDCIEESEVEPPKPAMSMVTTRDPKTIKNALQKKGYKAEMDTDSRGDPRIKSRVSGLNYNIYFYGCEEGKNCNSIQFSLGIGLADGMSFERANQWNWKKRLSIRLDDENNPYLKWNVMMEPDGIPSSTFDEVFALWEVAVDQFKDFADP